MRGAILTLAFLALAAVSLALCTRQPEPALAGSIAHDRAARLARGVNISHWMWLPHDPASIRTMITPADAAQLVKAGLTHIRLPVEPSSLYDREAHSLNAQLLADLRWAIDVLTAAGLAVVVDPHPSRTPWAEAGSPTLADDYTRFWSALAAALADTDPEWVYLEVMNEPHGFQRLGVWAPIQARVVAAIRAAAPHHTIIATGDDWGGIDGLLALEPLKDTNVIYSFHFYDPHNFTHQGATWGAPHWAPMRDVPYPATPTNIAPAIDATHDDNARDVLRAYAREGWDAHKLRSRIDEAAAWAKRRGVPLYCGEFGVYRKFAPAEARVTWLRDVTTTFREHGIAWAMWDYNGGFDLARGEPGNRTLDPDTAQALGLTP